ncbi:MAG: hypothetical protein AWU57_180 [Marinobacter sp. T13-3]|nr:MAG: hypothetical protein AWU57_180 [Marinobacter sp. T13-3]
MGNMLVPVDPDARSSLFLLGRLRGGQPNPALMAALSNNARVASEFAVSQVQARLPLVRLVVGGMGGGKSTFMRLVQESVNDVDAIPLSMMASSTKGSPIPELTVFFMGGSEALNEALMRVAHSCTSRSAIPGDIQSFIARHSESMATMPLAAAVRHACNVGLAGGEPETGLGRAYQAAMQAWFGPQLNSDIREFLERCGHSIGRKGIGKIQHGYHIQIIRAHAELHSLTGVYPIWFLDEFESYSTHRESSRDIILGFLRDVIDVIFEEDQGCQTAAGGLFVFATPDGQKMISGYPALSDRLAGSKHFNIASPTWRTEHFAEWKAEKVLGQIGALFRSAGTVDTSFSGVIAEQMLQLSENAEFQRVASAFVMDANREPRERLKALLCDYLDILGTDKELFWSRHREFVARLDAHEASLESVATEDDDLDDGGEPGPHKDCVDWESSDEFTLRAQEVNLQEDAVQFYDPDDHIDFGLDDDADDAFNGSVLDDDMADDLPLVSEQADNEDDNGALYNDSDGLADALGRDESDVPDDHGEDMQRGPKSVLVGAGAFAGSVLRSWLGRRDQPERDLEDELVAPASSDDNEEEFEFYRDRLPHNDLDVETEAMAREAVESLERDGVPMGDQPTLGLSRLGASATVDNVVGAHAHSLSGDDGRDSLPPLPDGLALPLLKELDTFQDLGDLRPYYAPKLHSPSKPITTAGLTKNSKPGVMAERLAYLCDLGIERERIADAVAKSQKYHFVSQSDLKSHPLSEAITVQVVRFSRQVANDQRCPVLVSVPLTKHNCSFLPHARSARRLLQAVVCGDYVRRMAGCDLPDGAIQPDFPVVSDGMASLAISHYRSIWDRLFGYAALEATDAADYVQSPAYRSLFEHESVSTNYALGLYNPFESLGALRHFVFYLFAEHYLVPDPLFVDSLVMHIYKVRYPNGDLKTSRQGVFFYTSRSALGIFDEAQHTRLQNVPIIGGIDR